MTALVLVLNCGSSSIKFSLLNPAKEDVLISGVVEKIGTHEAEINYQTVDFKGKQVLGPIHYQVALQHIVPLIAKYQPENTELIAVGHRVVHGGSYFSQSVIIDKKVIQAIGDCVGLAPLHNPANLLGIEAAQQAFPNVPQVAVFDTAFHHTLPDHAYIYALPYSYYTDYQVRRYGFHGISYRYLTPKAVQLLNKPLEDSALVIAHLGNGCSACAVLNGKSIDTTMGLTPLEGLVMGTRSGDIDPGLFDYLSHYKKTSGSVPVTDAAHAVEEITQMLNKQSGLLGISDVSMDMRKIEQAAREGHYQSQLAIEIFCYRLAKYIAALAVPLGRIDALVFSGGIGENAVLVREKTLARLSLLGFKIDPVHNANHGMDNQGCITAKGSTCALVIKTNEELMIALDAMALVNYK